MNSPHNARMKNYQLPTIWPHLACKDVPAMMQFLESAFGFKETVRSASEDDPSTVHHAEMLWSQGGGIMLSTVGKDDTVFGRREPGRTLVYLVCSNPDELFEQATAAGAEVVQGLNTEDYGSRGFTVADREGNLWSFGTYAGEAAQDAPPAG